MRSRPLFRTVLACLAAACALAACGPVGDEDGRPDSDSRLILDFTPNAVHAGIFLAKERGYDQTQGVNLDIETPSSSTDSVKLLSADRADLAIMDIHDLALARAKGADLVGVMAIVQTPLAAVLAQPGISRPRDLEGKRVGVTGLPSDDAVLDSIVRGDGGTPSKVRRTTIGFDAVAALLGRKVSGATAFWNVEGLALKARRPGIREFRVDDYGAPSYPELVLVTARQTLTNSPQVVRATVRAIRQGYEAAIDDPLSAVTSLLDAEPTLKRAAVSAQFDAVSPSFTLGAPRYGQLDPARLQAWAAWEKKFGIVKDAPVISRMFSIPTSRLSG